MRALVHSKINSLENHKSPSLGMACMKSLVPPYLFYERDLFKREDALLATWSMWGGEKRGNTRARSPRLTGQAARVHDVRVEWSKQIGSSPLRRCSFLLQFCFAAGNSDLFVLDTFQKIRCVKTAWSPDKLSATYPVRLRGVEIVRAPWSSDLSLYKQSRRLHATYAESI